ncbi:hypothetical protein FVE67_02680 [Thermosulfurimonas marina]|uniref:PBS lyase n=1 Tax=Thermosulfurimonas marina TaxID=2047767 RepID=A0A6H1WRI4_9BACT|nr:DVU0298 family protein [Thermosulfurimonas marina]QJA05769.1 hypothetical protein FVE67_02680 [Thermosulfurimonas marina]
MKPPSCPFCGREIPPPRNLGFQFADHDAGVCECGAVYVSDVTGFNRGSAFAEALFLASGGRWELAWDLAPGEDYQEIWLEPYDQARHLLVPEGTLEGRKVSGALCFVRLAEDLLELSREDLEALRRPSSRSSPEVRPRKLRRPEAERLVAENRREELLLLCRAQPLNLRVLQKILYHPEALLRLRTATLLGEFARRFGDECPEEVADLVKRLLYASADTAASAWGALEAVGEIIRALPRRFGLYVRNLLAFLPYPEFRPGALYALWRVAEAHPELLLREKPFRVVSLLEDENPLVRGLALLILRALRLSEAAPGVRPLLEDSRTFEIYLPEEDRFVSRRLKEVAEEILKDQREVL